jgi:hypothetical protein
MGSGGIGSDRCLIVGLNKSKTVDSQRKIMVYSGGCSLKRKIKSKAADPRKEIIVYIPGKIRQISLKLKYLLQLQCPSIY